MKIAQMWLLECFPMFMLRMQNGQKAITNAHTQKEILPTQLEIFHIVRVQVLNVVEIIHMPKVKVVIVRERPPMLSHRGPDVLMDSQSHRPILPGARADLR